MKKENSNLGFTKTLGLIFITLKLLNEITWSWWWVLSPLWIGFIALWIFGFIGEISKNFRK